MEVAYGTNLSNLVAAFTLSTGASATVGGMPQVSGSTANEFTNPITYVVTSSDESTRNWTVTVTVADYAGSGIRWGPVPD